MYQTCNTAGRASAYGYRNPAYANWRRRPKYNVPVNIEEKENSYEVSVYATGFDKENIKLSIVEDTLHISGTRTIEENAKPSFTKQEFPVKSFERVLYLNGLIDTAGINARQENSVLIITLPKTPGSQQPEQEIKID